MNTSPAKNARHLLIKPLLVILVSLTIISGSAAIADHASAANYISVRACFRWGSQYNDATGLWYWHGGAYANMPVQLNNRNSVTVKSGNTGRDGCATFYNVPANSRYYIVGYYAQRYQGRPAGTWYGSSALVQTGFTAYSHPYYVDVNRVS